MKVLVVGATGQIGRLVVSAALEAHHQVVAFSRNPQSIGINNPALQYHAGDILEEDDVSEAIRRCDAVIVTIGSGMKRKTMVRSVGTKNIVDAMQQQGVKRLICQSTLGAQESWSNLNFFWKRIMFGAVIRPVFQDHERQEKIVQSSDLDWTIVRPSAFKDKPGAGEYLVDIDPSIKNLKLTIAKSEVAEFLVSQLESPSYIQKAVGISR